MEPSAPDRTRRRVGLVLYVIAFCVGLTLLLFVFLVPPLFEPEPARAYAAMFLGGVLAIPAGLVYLTVPRLLDRYDPEPWYALVGCLMWGGVVACGFSALINSTVGALAEGVVGPGSGEAVAAVLSAPIVEEGFKCLGVWGVFYFLRRDFDGVVDGIIYATFTALGFAMVENVLYYSQAYQAQLASGEPILAGTFFGRGMLFPWVHPVYTSMFGIGIGLAREGRSAAVRGLAPFAGYFGAVLLHFVWNASATFFEGLFFLVLLPLWAVFVLGFLAMIVVLVRRRGKIIREHLLDEVALGTIDRGELALVCSPFGTLTARMRHGKRGADFVRATARLALSKWHTTRAMQANKSTMSMEFVAPLRRRIAELRASAPAPAPGGPR